MARGPALSALVTNTKDSPAAAACARRFISRSISRRIILRLDDHDHLPHPDDRRGLQCHDRRLHDHTHRATARGPVGNGDRCDDADGFHGGHESERTGSGAQGGAAVQPPDTFAVGCG